MCPNVLAHSSMNVWNLDRLHRPEARYANFVLLMNPVHSGSKLNDRTSSYVLPRARLEREPPSVGQVVLDDRYQNAKPDLPLREGLPLRYTEVKFRQ